MNWKKVIKDYLITGIKTDSRKVVKGDVFVAYKGVSQDGHNFIEIAIQNGARVVVGEQAIANLSVPYIRVKDGRLAWTELVACWYKNPELKLKFIGVTGTDGKTTTANLIYQIIKNYGKKTALVSTINAKIAEQTVSTGLHTSSPDPDELWKLLEKMVQMGSEYVVLETTSHGLEQSRFGTIEFEIGVLTNLGHDHLDYHQTIERYAKAKAKLLKKSKISVINCHVEQLDIFKQAAHDRIILYDRSKDIRKTRYRISKSGITQQFELKLKSGWIPIQSNLLGAYNQENILAAAKATETLGIKAHQIKTGIEQIKGLKGRWEWVVNKRELKLIVDFAHTEQAMKNILKLVGSLLRKKSERIIVVFGCNGERDKSKRAPMGQIACKLADLVVITTEDPRNESLDQIYQDIEKGCIQGGGKLEKSFWRVDDRADAIDFAINQLARQGDWVLFLGKGHEQSMNIKGVEIPWNEIEVVKQCSR